MRVLRESRTKGIVIASETVAGLIVLLWAMTGASGGFVGLPDLITSLAYSVMAMVPLFLVIFIAVNKTGKDSNQLIVAANQTRERSRSD